jgi:putative transposase
MLEYKMKDRGKTFVKADKYFPSTQLCSTCGFKNTNLKGLSKLSVRYWTCSVCGTTHDRDVNSARNLANYSTDATSGIYVRGDNVRPMADMYLPLAVVDETGKSEGHVQSIN